MDGEGQGDGVQGVFTELSHENTVHNVVKGLHQHGNHDWDCHTQQQLIFGHDTHFVLRRTVRTFIHRNKHSSLLQKNAAHPAGWAT